MPLRILMMALPAMMMLVPPALGQQIGDPVRGNQLARQWCSSCHVVERSQGGASSDAIPTFASIAAKASTTRISLLAFFQTPHQQMPNLVLARDDASDVAEYILSLRRR